MSSTTDYGPGTVLDNMEAASIQGEDIPETPVLPFDMTPPHLTKGEVEVIKRRLENSNNYAEQDFLKQAEENLRLWEGKHYQSNRPKRGMVVNYVLPTVETRVASIAYGYPEFYADPLSPESEDSSKVALAVLKWAWKKADVQQKAKLCAWDKEVFSYGVMFVGWLTQTTDFKTVTGVEPINLTPGLTPEEQQTEEAKVIDHRFYVARIDPRNFLLDPGCGQDIEDARYCGYWELWPLEEVKQDKRYKNTRDLTGSSKSIKAYYNPDYQKKSDSEIPSDMKMAKLEHYFEKRRRLHAILCEGKLLLVERWDWEHGRYPFRVIHGPCAPGNFYGVSTPALIEDAQLEINESRTQVRDHRRKANRKVITAAGNLNPFAKKALQSAEDLALIETTADKPVTVTPPMEIQSEVWRADQWAKGDINVMTHLDQYETNTVGTFRKTKAEVQAIRSGGGAVQQADADDFERFLEGIARDCIDLHKQFAVYTQSLPIYDATTNARTWTDFTPDSIRGDYDLYIYAGSTQPDNSEDKVKNIGFLLQTLTPYGQPGPQGQPPMVNLLPLLQQLIQAVPYIKNTSQIISSPSPVAPPPPASPLPQPGGSVAPPMGPPPLAPPAATPSPDMPPELIAIMQILQALPQPVLHSLLQQLAQAVQPQPQQQLGPAGPPLQ